ncbi:hypothetical protein HYPBUDRAFT_105481 [Hyphopichia burtonii NRRL Y-1933]|uniref:Aminopeptidase n=1 Tax=Hyphopichia burtonii NRRL Y-1933 TaxID=984485 RepID=A0A1E4RNN9_9ASCO|nr:hypothetical protein HYPBUDRAFT_105481 [Hyphopichia burtonii NRRL Y-1933]ODV68811.1 hypothetical protein HYPBUDRAFT_105481 [Hyphopichia burtonii NRRL Y-1933]
MCQEGKIRDTSKPYYEALPTALQPFHYDVSIYGIDIEAEKFKGTVKIHLNVIEDTQELHLNYRDLAVSADKIKALYVDGVEKQVAVASIEEVKQKEYFIIKFDEVLKASSTAKFIVTLEYDAIIQTNMAGFYKSSYKENEEVKYMLSTQFEATDARRAFPCLDEPALKATFTVDVTISSAWDALGNTPVAQATSIGGSLKKVTFDKTPLMSTYLLAWAAGEFEYIEAFTDNTYYNDQPLPVRIYTTKGFKEEAEFALSITPKIIDYYSKIFKLKYPLPKLDLIAVHSFSHNAMENWGLITYRSTALLYSESKSDPSYKKKVAYVVAHELAHQWFGNLVTMKWWDELWLNEGFATWVGYLAVDHLFPEWDFFSVFVSESLQAALDLDSLRNSHSIEVPVNDALDIDQLFDEISYLKGSSTILMISNYLGTDVFLEGVANYLNNHKFGNATSHNLWSAISETSGKPIDELMDNWVKKTGYPIINVDLDIDSKTLSVSQSRYLRSGDLQPEENETVWWVPLNFSSGIGTKDIIMGDEVLKDRSKSITNFENSDKFFKLNKDTKGAYRVNYSPYILQNNILPHFDQLSTKDKIGFIADVASIAITGDKYTSTTTLLKLLKAVVIDHDALGEEYVVWLELGKRLGNLLTTFGGVDDDLTRGLTNFSKELYSKLSIKLLNAKLDEDNFLEVKLRAEIFEHAGLFGVPEVKEYAVKLFEDWKQGKAIHPSLKLFVFTTIVSSSELITESNFESILKEVTHPTSLNSREVALTALGHINNDDLSTKLIGYLIQPDIIPIMDSHFLGVPLSRNVTTRDKLWKFFAANYETLYKLMSTNMVVLDRFIKLTFKNYQSSTKHDEIENFFSDKDVHGFERAYKQGLDNILINASWFKRDQAEVKNWIKEYNFA